MRIKTLRALWPWLRYFGVDQMTGGELRTNRRRGFGEMGVGG